MSISLVPSHARWSFPLASGNTGVGQYQFVQVTSTAQIEAPSATGVFCVILDDAPSNVNATLGSNDLYTGGYVVGVNYGCVLPTGVVQKVYYGGTLNAGVPVMANTSGQAVAATGGITLGYTMEAGASGELHPILFKV